MKLSNAQLLNYVERIKFSREDKQKYQTQIDNLISNVQQYIKEHTNCKVIKVLQSGSWRKGTILYPKDGVELDIDLVFFLDDSQAKDKDVKALNGEIELFLQKVYPNKAPNDFWSSPKTAGVVFRGTGLNFDIVPVVPIEPEPYVWQPEKGSNKRYVTSIENQLKFNSYFKDQNPNYTAIVRVLKKWKQVKSLKLSSFSIEIIEAWLEYNQGHDLPIEDAVIRFFDFLGRYKFPVIEFNLDLLIKTAVNPNSKGAIYVADSANPANNTAEYLKTDDWTLIQDEARQAYDTLMYAKEVYPFV